MCAVHLEYKCRNLYTRIHEYVKNGHFRAKGIISFYMASAELYREMEFGKKQGIKWKEKEQILHVYFVVIFHTADNGVEGEHK